MLIRVLSGEKGIRQNNVVGTEVLYKDSYYCHGWSTWQECEGFLVEDYYNGEFDPGSG